MTGPGSGRHEYMTGNSPPNNGNQPGLILTHVGNTKQAERRAGGRLGFPNPANNASDNYKSLGSDRAM